MRDYLWDICRRSVWYAALLIVVACARQGFPPGGPEDKTPPEVVATSPPANAVHVPPTVKVLLTFSEEMHRQAVEQALFIVPTPTGRPLLRWRGRTLSISFSEPLRLGRTYVLTVGTEARDLRNNRMRQAFSLAFSTGSALDSCTVTGRVYATGTVAGTTVWAYDLSANPSPDPCIALPDYVTQCAADGEYALQAMAPGLYRLFAFFDREANRRYDPDYDPLGVPAGDVTLSADFPSFGGCDFRLVLRDTTAPRLESAIATDARHVHLRFTEPMQDEPLTQPDNYCIAVREGDDTLQVMAAYVDAERRNYVHLATSHQRALPYRLLVRQGRDVNGLPLQEASVEFTGSAIPDTLPPRVARTWPQDSARAVACVMWMRVAFTEAIDTARAVGALVLVDSAGQRIPGRMRWLSPAQCLFAPARPLSSRSRHQGFILGSLLRDVAGLPLRADTVRVIFSTMNCDTLSSIAGTVLDEDSTATGPVVLCATQVRPKGDRHELTLPEPGPYEFAHLLPGVYLLEAYRDQDANGRYSPGSTLPFVPSERFVVFSDSIQVRSRWPNVGNDIVLPRWPRPPLPDR